MMSNKLIRHFKTPSLDNKLLNLSVYEVNKKQNQFKFKFSHLLFSLSSVYLSSNINQPCSVSINIKNNCQCC